MKAKLVVIQICVLIASASSYRILTLLSLANKSNMNYFDVINLELAKKGHSITVISPTRSSVQHQNIRELEGLDFSKIVKDFIRGPSFFDMRLNGDRLGGNIFLKHEKFASDCHAFYQLPSVQSIIQNNERFDLVLTMAFMNECVFGLLDHLNASSVLISTVPAMPWHAEISGSPTILSYVPHTYYAASSDMTFWQRVGNMVTYLFEIATRNYVYIPAIEAAYRKYLPNAAGIHEITHNMSVVLGAGHSSFGPLRPAMPDLIDDIGGIHCRPAEPLPNEISELILDKSGKETDFIYFSLGSVVQGHQVPELLRTAFLTTFAKLDHYTVLWKWEADLSVDDRKAFPPNVKVSKWFPQQDVLGHPRCKLFISHGGLSSVHEALYHGVPIVGLPFFGDQDWNMKQIEDIGAGVKVELSDVSEQYFSAVLNKLLSNPTYTEKMKQRSILFRDRQNTALETSVWWIEYVLRTGGATHLRSPARSLNTIQYYCVDVLIFLALSLCISAYGIRLMFRRVFAKQIQKHKTN